MADSTDWQPLPMEPAGEGWRLTREYPPDARDEYLFLAGGRAMLDPLNPHPAPGGLGPHSVCQMPDYVSPRPIELPVLGKMERRRVSGRVVDIYVPPVVEDAALLVVLDGYEYEWLIGMPGLLDGSVRDRLIPPVMAVFVAPGDREAEYNCGDSYLQWMADRLVPAIRKRYPVDRSPERTGIVGASFGGLAATYGVMRRPDVFLLGGAQSPAYRAIGGVDLLARLAETRNVDWSRVRVHVDGGRFEMMLHGREYLPAIRSGVEELRGVGAAVQYNEVNEGHNWTSWRARLPGMLAWLLAPQRR